MKTLRTTLVVYLLMGICHYVYCNSCEFSVQEDCTCTSAAAGSLLTLKCSFQSPPMTPLITSNLTQVVIQVLDLSHNNLTNLPSNFFQFIIKVMTLDLSYNSFTTSPPLLEIMKNTTVVNLSHNQLTVLDHTTLNEKSPVRALDLSYNKINRIDVADNHTLQLYILNLAHNSIRDVPDLIWKAADSLDLSYNLISSLSLIPMSQMKYMMLSGNQLSTINPKTFSQLHYLDELYLDHNRLRDITADSFDGAWALTEIDLNNNLLVNIEYGLFRLLPNLITIKVAHNKIEKIPTGCFVGVEDNLQRLSLQGNKISNISISAFAELENLRHLDLSDNPTLGDINRINFPPHLASLDLSNCSLQTIDDCKFATYMDLQSLGLANNNLACSCHLSWLYKWQKHMNTKIFVYTNTSIPEWKCLDSDNNLIPVSTNLTMCQNMSQHFKHCREGQNIIIDPDSISLSLTVSTGTKIITTLWSMKSEHPIHGFIVTYATKDETYFESPLLPSTATQYVIKDMEVSGSYTVCLHALLNETYTIKKVCQVEDSDFIQMIIGIMAGIVFIVPCVVALVYILYKDYQVMKDQDYEQINDEEHLGEVPHSHSEVKVIDEVKVSDKIKVMTVPVVHEHVNVPPSTKAELSGISKASVDNAGKSTDKDHVGSFQRNEAFVADCGRSHGSDGEITMEICEECHQGCDSSEDGNHFLTKL